MRKREKNMAKVFIALIVALILCSLTSCTTTKYVETIKTDTIHLTHHKIDSIQLLDSVYVKEVLKGDTVMIEKTKYLFRDRTKLVTDTVKEKIVEIKEVPIEVEKKLTTWQKIKINTGEIFLCLFALSLVVIAILWIILSHRKNR